MTIDCGKHGKSARCVVCKHILTRHQGLRYFAISRPFPAARWLAWCEDCNKVLEQEEGWTDRTMAFAGLQGVCKSCYKDLVRRHRRIREPLALGHFANETSAAIAYDLAARVEQKDPSEWNFADEMLRDLLPIFGDDVAEGLKEVPSPIKDALLAEMRRLAA
jgi:hypothetical protein